MVHADVEAVAHALHEEDLVPLPRVGREGREAQEREDGERGGDEDSLPAGRSAQGHEDPESIRIRPDADIILRLVKVGRSPAWRRALPAAGLLAVAAYFAYGVPTALVASWTRAAASRAAAREGAEAALVRFRGPEYAAAIARIREALPEDAEYLLLESPAQSMVRFDLAPRRAVFGGNAKNLAANVTPALLPSLPKWTVIASVDPPGPRLVETRVLAEKGAIP